MLFLKSHVPDGRGERRLRSRYEGGSGLRSIVQVGRAVNSGLISRRLLERRNQGIDVYNEEKKRARVRRLAPEREDNEARECWFPKTSLVPHKICAIAPPFHRHRNKERSISFIFTITDHQPRRFFARHVSTWGNKCRNDIYYFADVNSDGHDQLIVEVRRIRSLSVTSCEGL